MHDKTHGHNPQNALKDEHKTQHIAQCLTHLVELSLIVTVRVVIDSQDQRVEKDAQYDKVLEVNTLRECDYALSQSGFMVQTIQRSVVIDQDLLVLFLNRALFILALLLFAQVCKDVTLLADVEDTLFDQLTCLAIRLLLVYDILKVFLSFEFIQGSAYPGVDFVQLFLVLDLQLGCVQGEVPVRV